jgi:Protein of unknown function (DUF3800)
VKRKYCRGGPIIFTASRKGGVTVIAGYFDESADQNQKKIFVVAGFLGRNYAFIQMESRWKKLLAKYDLEYYHAVECEHGMKQFKKFVAIPEKQTDEERVKLQTIRFEFLNAAVTGEDIAGFATGVALEDFDDLCKNPTYREAFGKTPFYYCYHLVMLSAVREVTSEWGGIVAFVGDRHQQHSKTMLELQQPLREAYPDLSPHIGSITFDDKRNYIGLQVADVLAYEVRKMFQDEMNGYAERAEYKFLRDNGICKIELCKRECLEHHLIARGVFENTSSSA